MKTLVTYRWHLMALMLAATVALGVFAARAAVPNNSLTVWFVDTDPKLEDYHTYQQHFGNDELVMVHVHDDDGLFTHEALSAMRVATERFVAIDGVRRVTSVLDAPVFGADGTPKGLVPDEIPTEQAALDALREVALEHPMAEGVTLTTDAKSALMILEMDAREDFDDVRVPLMNEITSVADDVFSKQEHALGGTGIIYAGLNIITARDFAIFLGLGYLLMFVMLWVLFRRMRLVAASLGVIMVGTVFAIGGLGLIGERVNMITVILPTLIIVLGIADAVHFPVAFLRARQDAGPEDDRYTIAARALKDAFVPCLMTTVTTMAGFLALVSSPIATIQHLGIFSAVGVAACLAACLVFMGVTFVALGEEDELAALPEQRWIDRGMDRMHALLARRPLAMGAVAITATAVSVLGATRVETNMDTIGYLPSEHRVVTDHVLAEGAWGGYSPLEFLVLPEDGRKADDPEVARALKRFAEAAAAEHPDIHGGVHIGDVYAFAAQATPNLPEDQWLSDEVAGASRASLRERVSWDEADPAYMDNPLAPFVTEDGAIGRMSLRGKMVSAAELAQALEELEVIAQRTMGGVARVEPSGYLPLYVGIIDYVVSSQVRGFFIALGLIFMLMLGWARSLRIALVSLAPNVFPVVVMMGVMGAAGIDLDVATATIGAIVLGVAIDDTVHFLHAWRKAERDRKSWEDSVAYSFRHAGKAAVVTTTLLLTGFPVLMLAQVTTVFAFGLLTSVAAAAALFADLVILPLVLKIARPSWSKA